MNPDLEAELNEIGWQKVKALHPSRARILAQILTPTGGALCGNRSEIKQRLDEIEAVRSAALKLFEEIDKLPSEIKDRANFYAADVSEYDAGVAKQDGVSAQAIGRFWRGLCDVSDDLKGERVGGRNAVAHRIADAMVEIFIRAHGERPRHAYEPNGGQKFYPFTKALRAVLGQLGHDHIEDMVNLTKAAKVRLSDNDIVRMQETEWQKVRTRRVSLVTGKVQRWGPSLLTGE